MRRLSLGKKLEKEWNHELNALKQLRHCLMSSKSAAFWGEKNSELAIASYSPRSSLIKRW